MSTEPDRRLAFGLRILSLFIAAVLLQALIYGGPRLLGFSGYRVPGWFYFPLFLLFMFGPGTAATVIALVLLRNRRRRQARTRSVWPIIAVILLGLASCYLGVFVSFNTWGS